MAVTKSQFSKFKAKAKKRGKSVALSFEQYCNIKLGDCYYCGVQRYLFAAYCQEMGLKTPYMTIDRKDNKGGYTEENSVASCFLCNKTKSNIFTSEDMKEIGERYIKPKYQKIEQEVWDKFLEELEYEST